MDNKNKNVSAGHYEPDNVLSDYDFAQINLLHCKKATQNYCDDLMQKQTNISLIQEPWIRGNKVHGFGQLHNRLFYNRAGVRPRAAIHVSPDTQAMLMNQFTSDDLVTVRVCRNYSEGGDFLVVSVYLPYDSKEPPPGPHLSKVVEFGKENKIPVIIGADANSHHTIWGSKDVNPRGEELVSFLLNSDLMVLNRGNKPTFVNAIRQECIDLTLVSSDITELVHSWRVTEEITFSDHRLIRFSMKGHFPARKPYRNPRKTEWNRYRTLLEDKLRSIGHKERYETSEELDKANDDLTKAIVDAYEASCPLINPKPWNRGRLWSGEVNKLKRELRKAWNRAGKVNARQEANRKAYREKLREYNQAREDLKRKSKEKFFEEANSIPAYARIHKLLAKDSTAQVGSLLKPDGSFTVDSEETAQLLLETHFPGCISLPERRIPVNRPKPARKDWAFAERLTKKGKVRWAIFKFYSFKSAGLDGIFPALLKEGLELILHRLMSIFKSSIALGSLPKLWEKVRVVFIPKVGRPSHGLAKDFRPISLTSFLLKAVERLLDFYIREEVLKKYPLHACQHAYQIGKSTDSALHQLTQRIERMLNSGKIALGCFMDVEGAFDNTDFGSIAAAARNREMDPVATDWIVEMLRSRSVEAVICGTSVKMGVTRGTPQGGILSPILWCLVIDSLLVTLNDSGLYTQGFSDDLASLITGDFLSTVGDLMRATLNIVEDWCLANGLKVNPVKTKMVLFSRRKSGNDSTLGKFTLFGENIPLSTTAKFLGVLLDCKLLWVPHLNDKLNKTIGIFWLCRNAFGRNWGLSPTAISWIYSAVIKPILSHGSLVWWPRVEVKWSKGRLDKLQRLACLCMTGAKNTVSSLALEALLNIPPLDLHIKSIAFNAAFNLKINGCWSSSEEKGHTSIAKLLKCDEILMRSDQMKKLIMPENHFGWIIPEREEWLGDNCLYPPRDGIICYTDGSKNDSSSGAGVFCEYLRFSDSIPTGEIATVHQTEIFAISVMCTKLEERPCVGEKITICTDSQSAIEALSSPVVQSKLVYSCKLKLNSIGERNEVTLLWVPGHVGIEGNEKADELARKGAEKRFIGPEPYFGIPMSTRKLRVKDWLRKEHVKIWSSYVGAKHTKIFLTSPSSNTSKSLLKLGRTDLKRVIEAMTGHCSLNAHLFKIGLADSPNCLCGRNEETGYHIISECPRYRLIRRQTLGKPDFHHTELKSLEVEKLADFLRKTKRL